MKYLILMRHAKSSWKDSSLQDIDRPLNERGLKDTPLVGKELLRVNASPNAIWVSTSKRTLETMSLLQTLLSFPEQNITYREELYLAHALELLGQIKDAPDSLEEIMILGHNPGLTDLLFVITGEDVENISTASAVRIMLDVDSWKDVGKHTGSIDYYITPEKLKA